MEIFAKKVKHIDELHFEHQLWIAEIKFYHDELMVSQKYLDHIATRNTGIEVRKQIEHFQNQFIIQREQLDILKHDIKIHDQWLARFAAQHPVAIDHYVFADHNDLRDKANSFKKIYTELKGEFIQFVSAQM